MKKLMVRGPYLNQSGYGHHTRHFILELLRQGIEIELRNASEWGPPDHLDTNGQFSGLDRPVGAEIALHFCMPHQLRADPEKLNVNYTMFEATRLDPQWVPLNLTHDLVIVPTESSRQAWVASGMPPHRVRICPLGVDTGAFHPPVLASELPPGPKVRFLNVSDYNPRKNLIGLLRAWVKATRRDDDAMLTIKTNRKFRRFRPPAGIDRAAPVRIIETQLYDSEMPQLYHDATHYISASCGEGWDLPMMEAGASGLRLIAPQHSSYQAYLDASTAALIPSRQVMAPFSFEGAEWWVPEQQPLMEAIRAAIDGREPPRESPRERFAEKFTWRQATQRLIETLSEIEPLAERRRRAVAFVGKHGRPKKEEAAEARPASTDGLPAIPSLRVTSQFDIDNIVNSIWMADEYQMRWQTMDPGDVVIDIGANIGAFSSLCHSLGSRAVHAFEPSTRNFELLGENVGPLEGVHLYRAAVWRSDGGASGAVQLSEYSISGSHSVLAAGRVVDFAQQGFLESVARPYAVEAIALDRILERFPQVRLLKIDCEGSEFPILLTSKLLGRCERIVGEVHEQNEAVFGSLSEEAKLPGYTSYRLSAVVELLERQGFRVQVRQGKFNMHLFYAEQPREYYL